MAFFYFVVLFAVLLLSTADDVQLALKSGLMKGTGSDTFSPKSSAHKEQAAVIDLANGITVAPHK